MTWLYENTTIESLPEDCVGSYFPEFQAMGLNMIKAQGGIFGWVGASKDVIAALKQ